MNEDVRFETKKRLFLLNQVLKELPQEALGAILVGSMAYAPNTDVHKESDIDLLVIYPDVKICAPLYFPEQEVPLIQHTNFDGYLVKKQYPTPPMTRDIHVSLHNLSLNAFRKITQGDPQTLSYYRQTRKDKTYVSFDFDGYPHAFTPIRTNLPGLSGEQRLDSIAFFGENGNYVIGNDMDKLLSGAQIKQDPTGILHSALQGLWHRTSKRLYQHRLEHNQPLQDLDLGPYLCRYSRFSDEVKFKIKQQTQKSMSVFLPVKKTEATPIPGLIIKESAYPRI